MILVILFFFYLIRVHSHWFESEAEQGSVTYEFGFACPIGIVEAVSRGSLLLSSFLGRTEETLSPRHLALAS